MDHNEAVRLQAAEKYVLGELTRVQREDYEEHYFDCSECALDVKAAAAFVDASRQVFATEPVAVEAESSAKSFGKAWSGWLFWLRPAFAVPAMAILVLGAVVAYQNLVTLPAMKGSGLAGRAQVFNSFSLVGANVRGEGGVSIKVHRNETFALDFDFLPTRPFDHYLCQLQDETGRVVLQTGVPAEKANQEAHLLVPNGVEHAGKYSVVISGDAGAKGTWVKENEVSRMNFVVEILP